MAKHNSLRELERFGQSVWIDFISRKMMNSGELKRFIEEDGVTGMTSNPAIFEKAFRETADYDEDIRTFAQEGMDAREIFFHIAVKDIQMAADLFRPIYDWTEGKDGFVSLEVAPDLAHNTDETIAEARRIWESLERPNVLVKIPATREGIPAIRQLISEGININVTLLFGLPRYRAVADAYIQGVEERLTRNQPIDRVASVASFFLSRIDVLVDRLLKNQLGGGTDAAIIGSLKGQAAVASAKVAYQIHREVFEGRRFRPLAGKGARVQKLLWASTSTKNPEYSDVKYVEPLIGPNTINTMPLETLQAYRHHGKPAARIEDDVREAYSILGRLPEGRIDLDAVTQQLEDEGIVKFVEPFDELLEALETKRNAATEELAGVTY